MGSDDSASEQGRGLACPPPLHLALLDRPLRVERKIQWEPITARSRLLQQATTGLKHSETIIAAHQYFQVVTTRAVQIQTLAVDPVNPRLRFKALAHGLKETLPYHCPWWRPGMPEGRRSIVRVAHRPPPRLAAWSQHVNDVGEEDEAHDGKEHQHQNVHHGENTVRNGRRRREDTERENRHGSRCGRSAMIGAIRAFSELSSPLPLLVQNRKWSIGMFSYHFHKFRHKFQS